MGSLQSSDISLYSREYVDIEIISSCGSFPNIPLIRARGCVNSNPFLSIRQLGYLIKGPPEERSLEAFLLYDLGVGNHVLFKRIKEAWKSANIKGKADLGRMNGITKEPYFQWVREKVELIKMSLNIKMLAPLPDPNPTNIPVEEAEELRATIIRLTKENEELHQKLCKAAIDRDEFKYHVGKRNNELSEIWENF